MVATAQPTEIKVPEPKRLGDLTAYDLQVLIGEELARAVAPLTLPPVLKGSPVRAFSNQAINALSDTLIDFRGYNAASIMVIVNGTTPTAVVSLEGTDGGAISVTLPDPNAIMKVSASIIFDVAVGSAFGRMRLANISGSGAAFTVIVTPYVASGPIDYTASALHQDAVTPHDTNELAHYSRALYVGGAGNLTSIGVGDTVAVQNLGVPAGAILPIRARIVTTASTATGIVALW